MLMTVGKRVSSRKLMQFYGVFLVFMAVYILATAVPSLASAAG